MVDLPLLNHIRQVHHLPPVKQNSLVLHPIPMLPLPLPSRNNCRGSTKSKKRTITDETLRATTNALRYMDALRFSESQSFMHGSGL